MAKLSESEVIHVAKLANLNLSDKEIAKFLPQLSAILDYVGKLEAVNAEGAEPTSQTTGLVGVTRPDEAHPEKCLTADKALSGTDKTSNGLFVVPGVLKERSNK